ncbi:hypothetical protein HID58_037141 [Brassica napus]|uniref:Uncharacterized protein n=1 Tax=Brassica napus TaxID=3708 RepID=A0ABQ7XFV4_BRANA|nr:hypothetical protein HID58_037141 [Brassica napus]
MRDWNNPSSRIIRVSRASGGKDRHSKVLTSKGLRDGGYVSPSQRQSSSTISKTVLASTSPAKPLNGSSTRLPTPSPSCLRSTQVSTRRSRCLNRLVAVAHLRARCCLCRGQRVVVRRERERERESREQQGQRQDLQNAQSSFTQLLTGGFDEPNRNWIGGSSSDCFNPVQLIPNSSSSSLHHYKTNNHRQETSLNHHLSFVPDYNFGISSSDSPAAAAVNGGCYTSRGTLQSNSHSHFLNNNNVNQRPISFMATPPPLDHHNHQLPATFDGRLYLYYGEETGAPTIKERMGDSKEKFHSFHLG